MTDIPIYDNGGSLPTALVSVTNKRGQPIVFTTPSKATRWPVSDEQAPGRTGTHPGRPGATEGDE